MTAHGFDLGDLSATARPHDLLAELRSDDPVARLDGGVWAVTGYDQAVEALRQRTFTSGPIGEFYRAALPPGAAHDEMGNRINFLDPPDHPRVRGLVSKAFTPRRIADLLPWIRATADELVAEVTPLGTFDLLHEVAHVLPSLVISELLGVPVADRYQLTAWSDDVSHLLGASPGKDEIALALASAEHFHAYLGDLIDQRLKDPGPDLLSALLAAEEDGERLSRPELLSLAATLYSAGHRTTRDSFTNGLAALLADGGAGYRHVVAGRWDEGEVAAEILRLETPTLYVARIPVTDVELDGRTIAAREPVLVFLAAANRDPAQFDDPDSFRPGRDGPPPLSFAYGAHYCLGASLAKAEIEVLLAAVAAAWPHLRLAGEVHWHLHGPFRGVDELVVSVG